MRGPARPAKYPVSGWSCREHGSPVLLYILIWLAESSSSKMAMLILFSDTNDSISAIFPDPTKVWIGHLKFLKKSFDRLGSGSLGKERQLIKIFRSLGPPARINQTYKYCPFARPSRSIISYA
jgi:hypothetical protein